MEPEECRACEWYRKHEGPEMFKSCWGLLWFNVDKGLQLARQADRHPEVVEVERLRDIVAYPPRADGSTLLAAVPVEERHLDHVDMDKPLLWAWLPKWRHDPEDAKRQVIMIDGHHRLARAIRDGVPLLMAYLLTEEESDSILTDNRPPARRPRRSKKRKEG